MVNAPHPRLSLSVEYDEASYKSYVRFTNFRGSAGGRGRSILLLVCAFLTAFFVMLSVTRGDAYWLLFALPFASVLVMFLGVFLFAPRHYYKKRVKGEHEGPISYVFYPNFFTVQDKNTAEPATVRYLEISRVHETDTAFYLVMPSKKAFLLPKRYLSRKQEKELCVILREVFGKRYK